MSTASTTPADAEPALPLRVGLVQMCASRDEAENVATVAALVGEAAAGGARYVQTPEFTALMELSSAKLFAATPPEAASPALAAFRDLARTHGIWLHIGSMGVLVRPDKIANRSFLIAPDGAIAARYDKIHMFDAAVGGTDSFRESKNFAAGAEAVIADVGAARLGLSICYDLRFPQLYRALAKAGADIIAVPSAFTRQTGEAHWHTLLAARAIESGAWVLAAAQGGKHACGRETYGHSLVVSPWGEVVAEGGVHPSVIFADIQLQAAAEARRRLPALEHDRPFEVRRAAAVGAAGTRP